MHSSGRGKLLWAHAYGYADKEKALPMKLKTICRIESISKSVTAWGCSNIKTHRYSFI
ncbi:MAG: serine hydrolase [Spirochaetota bacterium]